MRIALIGNCQIRPLAHLLEQSGANCFYKGVAHLLKPIDQDALDAALEDADAIVTQQISESYTCQFVRTSRILETHRAKTIVILNLFYQAYNPELCYVRLPEGTVRGPLGDYHLLTLLDSWHQTGFVASGASKLADIEYNSLQYLQAIERTLEELRRRERTANVPIVDYIVDTQSRQKLFHTMNHPANILLNEYASRVARTLGLNPPACGYQANEHLGAFQLPTNPVARSALNLTFTDRTTYSGLALGPTGELTKTAKVYDANALCQAYQSVYDSLDSALKGWCARTFSS